MSGHSHWHNTHQQKEKANAARGVLFTRAAQQIIMAARDGGGDPNHNLTLRIAIDYAKSVNMPNENIDRAIKKGTGADNSARLEKAVYEGYGPYKVPFIVSTITDNKNRTVNELRSLFLRFGGELGMQGAVMWQFTESGRITVRSVKIKKAEKFGETDTEYAVDRDEAVLELMEVAEVEDITVNEDDAEQIFIKAPTNRLAQVATGIREKGYVIVTSGQHFEANNLIEIAEAKGDAFAEFIDTIENQNDVQDVWHAAK
jgi:YebC/PmpR family DNA-binding regulatory protein